jgi:hypothetical protein
MSLVLAPWSAGAKPYAWRSIWGCIRQGRAPALLQVLYIEFALILYARDGRRGWRGQLGFNRG